MKRIVVTTVNGLVIHGNIAVGAYEVMVGYPRDPNIRLVMYDCQIGLLSGGDEPHQSEELSVYMGQVATWA